MDCDIQDHVQRQIYFRGVYEPIEAYLFTRLITPGAIVIDAGANVGQYSLLASSAATSTGRVYSFEPVPATFDQLSQHIRKNRIMNVELNQTALWNVGGQISLGLASDQSRNAGAFSIGITRESVVPPVTARTIRLDDYIRDHQISSVHIVKMDIEGAEWAALQGMTDLIARDRPIILTEINPVACSRLEYHPEVFWEFLVRRFGYTAWQIGGSARSWTVLTGANRLPQTNVLFTPGELPSAIATGWDYSGCLRWARSGRSRRHT
jgi:FkbM family methyltransferase